MTNPNENLARLREKQDLERHIDELRQKRREISGELRKSPRDTKLLAERGRINGDLRNEREKYFERWGAQYEGHFPRVVPESPKPVSKPPSIRSCAVTQQLEHWFDEFGIHPPDEDYKYDSILYWQSLTGQGREFEIAVGKLFRDLHYNVKVTASSGDEGIDIRLEKDDEITIVQCKAQRQRVNRSTLQYVLGVADIVMSDWVACASTSGFVKKAEEFAKTYSMDLYGPEELARLGMQARLMRLSSKSSLVVQTSNAPNCPKCGKIMFRKRPYHRQEPFWGCSDWLRCDGTREIPSHS